MLLLATGAQAAAPSATPTARHPFGPDDLARIRTVSSPSLAPAGDWVAYTVRSIDAEADKGRTHVWMSSWDGSRHVQLTSRAEESESLPRFSPDGTRLGFLSERSGSGEKGEDTRLWLLDRAGGEAKPVPGIKGSVEDYVWSPDGRQLALILFDPDPEAKEGADDKPRPIVIDRYAFKTDDEGYRGNRHHRLWLYDFATGKARRLTSGEYDEALPAWSPDGRTLVFVSNRSDDPDRGYDSNLYSVPATATAPQEPKRLTSFAGADNDPDFGSYPAFSPDGSQIAYIESGPPELFAYGTRHLAVVPAAGGERRLLTAALDRNVTTPVWTPDGKAVIVSVEDDGAERIARVDAATGAVTPVAGGERVFSELTGNARGQLAALLSTPAAPNEVAAIDGAAVRQLSHQNDAWLQTVTLSPVTETRFRSHDGTEVHGFLTLPAGKPAKALPTILYNHGGPQAQWDWGFTPLAQALAARGYAVIATNPRGSTGRGQDYARAIYAAWGGVDVQDALAGVDDLVAKGIADPKRLGVGGWSYGGMLTNYVIASDKRFKAAVSGAGIGNALSGYGTDQYVNDYETELGKPWENREAWDRVSYPFLKNDRITTPTLFMVGQDDWNVPLINSEQMYQALRSRGVPTKLVIYPGEHHGLRRPSFLKDRMERWLGWYERFIK
jgi:dipeptidyl aminopeptidase/acylaminoacyl peptidase